MNKKFRLRFWITLILTLIFLGVAYFVLPPILGDAIYPLEYRDLIKKYSLANNLDPNFLAAVIRHESNFHPQATSPVGARGLLQIMPVTGLSIARNLGEAGSYNANKLYDPETSVRYGAWYLAFNLNKYRGNIDLTLIAYNAGYAAADAYARYRPELASNFQYAQIVRKNKAIYDQLYGQWWIDQPQAAQVEQVQPLGLWERITRGKTRLEDLVISWILPSY